MTTINLNELQEPIRNFILDARNGSIQNSYGDYTVRYLGFYEDGYQGVPDASVQTRTLADPNGREISYYEEVQSVYLDNDTIYRSGWYNNNGEVVYFI